MLSEKLLSAVRKENEKFIAIDFDGVLHLYITPFDGTDIIPDPPVEGALGAIKSLYSQGYKIVIFSARAKDNSAKAAIWSWLRKYGFTQYISVVTNIKPTAKVIVDDKAIQFKGDWFQTLKDIENFEPWQENPALK